MSKEKLHTKLDSILKRKIQLKSGLQTKKGKHEYLKFVRVQNYCLNALGYEYREIIEKSYLNPDYMFWWVDKYCKSSFYRRKDKAVSSFVQLFDLIYENYSYFFNNIKRACH